MNLDALRATSSTGALDSDLLLRGDTSLIPDAPDVHRRSSRLARLSASLATAFYVGTQSPLRLHVARIEDADWVMTANAVQAEQSVRQALFDLLTLYRPEELQDGLTLDLGIRLANYVKTFEESLAELISVALKTEADPETLSHVLRWVGRLADPDSFQSRLLLLTRALEASSATIRDGAGLGLVELGARAAIPALEAAIASEPSSLLRQDLEQAVGYLRSR